MATPEPFVPGLSETSVKPRVMSDYARVEAAIRYLQAQVDAQPSLAQVAAHVGLSEFHFQRLFQRWAGISPKRFLQFLTLEAAKRLLAERRSVLETSVSVGLSGPGRLHDLFLRLEHLTPGEYKRGAAGRSVHWGSADTELGTALFASLEGRLCGLSFLEPEDEAQAVLRLQERWPGAELVHDTRAAKHYAQALDARLAGRKAQPLSLLLKGTSLQFRVWEALLRIPPGSVVTYGELAQHAGVARGARAIGAAVGQNPIGYLIPCHRVIYSTGAFGHYAWGAARKAALLARELGAEGG